MTETARTLPRLRARAGSGGRRRPRGRAPAAPARPGWNQPGRVGDLLVQVLVRPGAVEVRGVLARDAPQARLVQHREVVEALAAPAPEGPLARGTLPWRA